MHPRWVGPLLVAVLITWETADPDRLVWIERKREAQSDHRYAVVAMVPGTHYVDGTVRQNQSVCYRLRYYAPVSGWSRETCIAVPKDRDRLGDDQ